MKIYKYMLGIRDTQTVPMTTGARILSAQVQDGAVCVWAIVDPSKPQVQRVIEMRGTGHNAHAVADLPFIDTVQVAGGSLVFHLFDGGEQ